MTASRTAVVVPGRMYGASAPLPMYSADAAEARGARIRAISWEPPPEIVEVADQVRADWVHDRVAPVLDETAGDSTLLIGKSLGTYAARLATERRLPAVWLTPILIADPIVAALRVAEAPCLLIGGTADEGWDGALARKLSPHVLEIDGADHGMYVPGPLAASAAVLGLVATAVERFLDEVVWPA